MGNNRDNRNIKSVSTEETPEVASKQIDLLLEKLIEQARFSKITKPDKELLEATAVELENNYKDTQTSDELNQTNQEIFGHFTDYCLKLVQSNDISDTKKNAILYLLKIRLQDGIF